MLYKECTKDTKPSRYGLLTHWFRIIQRTIFIAFFVFVEYRK
ncbi:hypothetical protein LDG_8276 [Legionella drancourtii LLAP12]|uniref:Uncharacterized protein n=1 Tax=Legionella drancourtii LLAP12 TaxID=658187 RepID=G9ESJ9_9GAMM|nr:hypothetical protein LDG_8276 [Legionella drancourtii LLAP12]